MLTVWIAILGIAFTTLAFYDFNPRQIFVEVAEELEEDGCEKSEKEGDLDIKLEQFFYSGSNIELCRSSVYFSSIHSDQVFSTCKGYILDLIKPPLQLI